MIASSIDSLESGLLGLDVEAFKIFGFVLDMLMIGVIETQAALDASCGEAAEKPWVGLDTEFERIRTYYPRLCLIQMSTAETTVCVDPLAALDFSPLHALLANPGVVKIFHAARQDLEVLYTAFGISVTALFDTQIAAQLCGYREQVAYAELAKLVCEIDLPKQYTRTAWCRRPLRRAEVKYALDDARYLGAIYLDLKHRLETLGRESWVREDCEGLTGPAIFASGPNRAIKKIQSGACTLGRLGQSIAFQLALWREETAQSRDRPREWILNSNTLLAIAAMLPGNAVDLEKIPELSASDRRRWSSAILSAVKAGTDHAAEYQPIASSALRSTEQKRTERLLWERLKVMCETDRIPTAAVAARADIRKLARGEQNIRLLQGWRRQFAGRKLRDLAAREGVVFTC
jgi:ribonuclease D